MNWQQVATFIFLFFMLTFSFWAYRLSSQKAIKPKGKKLKKTKAKKK